MAAALCRTSSRSSGPAADTLIRMAEAVAVPGGGAAPAGSGVLLDPGGDLHEGQRQLVGGRPDQHLVEHDVVEHLQARPAADPRRWPGRGRRCHTTGSVTPVRPSVRSTAHTSTCRARWDDWGVWCMASNPGTGRQVARDRSRNSCVPDPPGLTDQRDAAVVGDVEPLVRVGGPRIGTVEGRRSGGNCPGSARAHNPNAPSTCTQAPRSLAHSTTSREGVERTRVHLPGLSADHRRSRHVRREELGPQPPLVVGRDAAHRALAPALSGPAARISVGGRSPR